MASFTRLDRGMWKCDESSHMIVEDGDLHGEYCVHHEQFCFEEPLFAGSLKECREWIEKQL